MAKDIPKDIIEPRLLKGFRDYGPEEQAARQDMFRKIQTVFERFGFLPLSTPVLEYKDILMGKYGEDEKLVYSFKDNGDRDVAMRYDLTVPLARYVAQNKNNLVLPFKRYQIAPVWRADNPQKGRLREFYQCDIDNVGVDSPFADAEVVACLYMALVELGLTDCEIRFSNRMLFYRLFTVPDAEIQQILREVDKVKKIGEEEVLSRLKAAGVSEQGLVEAKALVSVGEGRNALENIARLFPQAADMAKNSGAPEGFTKLLSYYGVPEDAVVFDPLLVRGLDYYTNLVFEINLKGQPEFGSIVGGGRYDGLVSKFSETNIGAVGGSIGIDRLFDAMKDKGLVVPTGLTKVLIADLDEKFMKTYVELVTALRNAGINSELYYEPAKLEKQFKYAESKGIQYAVIMGEDEQAKGVVQLKNLKTREQTEVAIGDIVKKLQ